MGSSEFKRDHGKDNEKIAVSGGCFIDGCFGKIHAKNLCSKHYKKNRKYGDPLKMNPAIGENHWRWKGGRNVSKGHIQITVGKGNHPRADARGRVFEHILVAEKILGRCLPNNAVVHHINERKDDNRPENLIICQDGAYHKLIHARTRIVNRGGDPNTHKICCKCKYLKLKNEFCKHRSTWDNFQSICKECSKITAKIGG